MARVADIPAIKQIIQPLEESGILVRRTDAEVLEALESFTVVEREGHIIGCAALFPFEKEKCGEVAAIAVSPECRGEGQGDKLLGLLGVDLPSVPLTPYQRREGKKSIYPVDQNIIQSSCHLTRVEFVSIGCILELTLLAMSTSSLSDSAARVE
ncbi:unnamed protein product [Ilex paraguariensis]|uniref:N-acetyltransferase domain-containing protein n=1 Tax=Ilex paraguariensis TaxID=185542 RepID=A0ABC8TS85_9AQUA